MQGNATAHQPPPRVHNRASLRASRAPRPPAALCADKRAGWSTGRPVSLLYEDSELAGSIPASEFRQAACAAVAATATLPAKASLAPSARPDGGHLGCLVIEGLLIRRLDLAGACSVEPLGRGDLVRPWQEDSASFCEGSLRALTPVRLALLDEHFSVRVRHWPAIAATLVDRAVMRSRSLAALAAIGRIIGIEDRIMAFFWYLAERWGRRTREGVELDLPLTHGLIADFVGARRPPVSSAVARLVREQRLSRSGSVWVLRDDPPDVALPSRAEIEGS